MQQLCGFCFKKIQSMKASSAGSFDRGLIEAIRKSKARDRKSSAQKLVRETSTDFQQLEATNDSLKKQVKALQNRLRRAPARKPTKAKLGFKQKDPKSAPQTGPRPSQGQTAAIKKSKLKSY